MYQTHIFDRNYKSYNFLFNNNVIELSIDPFNEKLFDGDFFSIHNEKVEKKESIIKNNILQGILILQGFKTFGSTKDKKLLYKCVPNNPKLPCFLIPYNHPISFQKTFTNLFINFKFKEWTQKHPIGTITDIIGSVNDDKCLFEYELYCRNINHSIHKFSKYAIQHFSNIPEKKTCLKEEPFIFSIDPEGSTDFDDAFSVEENKIFIYISNVPVFLDKHDSNIWNLFSERTSTIYLPLSKKPMLPSILSDNLCSLTNNTCRETIVMEIDLSSMSFSFFIKNVFISKNFIYEETNLLNNIHYQLLLQNTRRLFSLHPDKYIEELNDSHNLVSYLMILMNHQIGLRLSRGIFRITENRENNTLPIPNELKQYLNIWNSEYIGKYIYSNTNLLFHSQLNINKYTHITSPIRRIVDIINLILFQQQLNLYSFSKDGLSFVEKWIHRTEFINECSKQIKKAQNKCNMIHSLSFIENIDGYIFSLHEEKYNVYLPKLNCYYSFKCNCDIEMYKKYVFKIHLFEDENNMNKRIKLSLVNENI